MNIAKLTRHLYIFQHFDQALSTLVSFNVIKCEGEYYSLAQNENLQSLLVISIRPFLYSYAVTLNVLKVNYKVTNVIE